MTDDQGNTDDRMGLTGHDVFKSVADSGLDPHDLSPVPGWKDTNPKDAVGTKRAPVSTVPMPVILEVGVAMLEGARKYGRHNFRAAGVRHSVYMDAIFRHMMAHWEGEDIDPDSGLPHVTKLIAAATVLRDSMMQQNDVDDRPPPMPHGTMAELNRRAAEIVDYHPDPPMPYTARGQQLDFGV